MYLCVGLFLVLIFGCLVGGLLTAIPLTFLYVATEVSSIVSRPSVVESSIGAKCKELVNNDGSQQVDVYRGNPTRNVSQPPLVGHLEIREDALIFVGRMASKFSVIIPVASIQKISAGSHPDDTVMIVHSQMNDHPRLYQFETYSSSEIVAELTTLTGREISAPPDRGPIQARQVRQNIYGRWERDIISQLYLAPNRLIFAGETAVAYTQIKQIGIMENLYGRPLLRVDFTGTDGYQHVIGWSMGLSHVEAWAADLHERLGVPLERYDPRKKKVAEQ